MYIKTTLIVEIYGFNSVWFVLLCINRKIISINNKMTPRENSEINVDRISHEIMNELNNLIILSAKRDYTLTESCKNHHPLTVYYSFLINVCY